MHPERITREDKKPINNLNYYGVAGADPERICEFSNLQCEKMSATMVADRENFWF